MDWLDILSQSAPQFLFATVLYWLCSQDKDKQRVAYENQLSRNSELMQKMLESIAESQKFVRSQMPVE